MVAKAISIVTNMLMINSCQVADMYLSSPAKNVEISTQCDKVWKLFVLHHCNTTQKTYLGNVITCKELNYLFVGVTLGNLHKPYEIREKISIMLHHYSNDLNAFQQMLPFPGDVIVIIARKENQGNVCCDVRTLGPRPLIVLFEYDDPIRSLGPRVPSSLQFRSPFCRFPNKGFPQKFPSYMERNVQIYRSKLLNLNKHVYTEMRQFSMSLCHCFDI